MQLHHLGHRCQRGRRASSSSPGISSTPHRCFAPPRRRSKQGAGPQSSLWPQGISGDLPIVLLRIADTEHLEIARQLLQAHEYWRLKGPGGRSRDPERAAVLLCAGSANGAGNTGAHQRGAAARRQRGRAGIRAAGGSAVRPRHGRCSLPWHGWCWWRSAAAWATSWTALRPASQAARVRGTSRRCAPVRRRPQRPALEFANGLGGFAEDGREYVTILEPGQSTPAPWVNVIANPGFGFHVSAEGSGYTWAVNSRENQLTPWSNDPVSDRSGEALYLRDEESGALWSPVAYPIRDPAGTYTARHGFGYSRFTHTAHGIATELLQFVPLDAPVKLSRLVLHNQSGRARRLSLTAYVEWVLGPSRSSGAAIRRHRARSSHWRAVRHQSMEQCLWRARGVSRPWRPTERGHRRPYRLHRPQRHIGQPAGAGRRRGALGPAGRRARPLRRLADDFASCRPAARWSSRFVSARRKMPLRRGAWSRNTAPPTMMTCWPR